MSIGPIFFCLGILFLLIGVVVFLSPPPKQTSQPAILPPAQPQAAARATPIPNHPFPETVRSPGGLMPPSSTPSNLAWIQVGDRIRVPHPVMGELTVYVSAKVAYQELWQTQRSPQAPWVPTGSTFLGFWLETNRFLLAWQNRCYLLDEGVPVSDAEIARELAPYARQFAQSNQTAEVFFAYPPASWKMDDIGKFRVAAVEGSGLTAQPGGVGRFIHASGSDQRALVIEDYEGSGGQDMAWNGYRIDQEEIKPV